VKAFPELALGTQGTIKPGDTILLLTPGYELLPQPDSSGLYIYGAFIAATGPSFAIATMVPGEGYSVAVPRGVNGQMYVVLTACQFFNGEIIAAGPAIVKVANL
jgi:hypothetical protein